MKSAQNDAQQAAKSKGDGDSAHHRDGVDAASVKHAADRVASGFELGNESIDQSLTEAVSSFANAVEQNLRILANEKAAQCRGRKRQPRQVPISLDP